MPIPRPFFAAALAVALMLFHTMAGAAKPAGSASLAALAQRYYDAQARLDPVYSATLVGDNRFDDQLPVGIAPAHRRKRFAMYRDVERQLHAIGRERLDPADQLTHDLLLRDLRTRLGFEKFSDHLLPLQQMDALPVLLATFGSGQAELLHGQLGERGLPGRSASGGEPGVGLDIGLDLRALQLVELEADLVFFAAGDLFEFRLTQVLARGSNIPAGTDSGLGTRQAGSRVDRQAGQQAEQLNVAADNRINREE